MLGRQIPTRGQNERTSPLRLSGQRGSTGDRVQVEHGEDELAFRYTHLTVDGDTATGHCSSTIEVLDDGRLRLHETWEWDSRPGHGTSTLEEIGVSGAQASSSYSPKS